MAHFLLLPRAAQPPPSKPVKKLSLVDRLHASLGKSLVEAPQGDKDVVYYAKNFEWTNLGILACA